jgi:hypothetical protein
MENNVNIPNCRQCPSGEFELVYVCRSRYMAICHARECVLEPIFWNAGEQFINKATLYTVNFIPLENCPHMEKLRAEGVLPWATTIADFTK